MSGTASAMLTDFYQFTMLAGYFEARMEATAAFEFFVRRLPEQRNFLIVAGIEQVIECLESFRITPEDVEWLAKSRRFRPAFLKFLEELRFTGDVDAMPEGTICFGNEPLLRVSAPIAQSQIVESRIVNLMQFQTMIASKAVRCVLAAPHRLLVDFGMRRAHGAEAALLSARASYLAGFGATSNVQAARDFGIPIAGTMAHSFVLAHQDEERAFEHFARANPNDVVFIIDTYDTTLAAEKAVHLAGRLRSEGIPLKGVRLDSGNLDDSSRQVREILDRAGFGDTKIFASGNLDEFSAQKLVASRAPIDGFGIGTRMNTSADRPYLDCAYKLVEYDGLPRCKLSKGKATLPGRKQVWRQLDASGQMARDVIGRDVETLEGARLLVPVMRDGMRVGPPRELSATREFVGQELKRLPAALRALESAENAYCVSISNVLNDLVIRVSNAPLDDLI